MYTGRLWTMRQYAGFGTADDTNRRFRALLAAGQTGLSTAFDLPTQMGYDSDHPMAAGEVGRVGVAIDTVDDLAALFQGIPLDTVSTSMTINATAAILLAMYVVVGEEGGVPRRGSRGTIQNDILKEYIARGTYIFPAEPSLRLIADIFRFVGGRGDELQSDFDQRISHAGGRRDRGAGGGVHAGQCLRVRAPRARAGPPNRGFRSPALLLLRRAQRPLRGSREVPRGPPALGPAGPGAIPGGRRHLQASVSHPDRRCHIAGAAAAQQRGPGRGAGAGGDARRNPVAPYQRLRRSAGPSHRQRPRPWPSGPSRSSRTRAASTATVDPLAGSYFVESLTDRIEAEARALIEEVDAIGGAAKAIEQGFFQKRIGESAYAAAEGHRGGRRRRGRRQQVHRRGATAPNGHARFRRPRAATEDPGGRSAGPPATRSPGGRL